MALQATNIVLQAFTSAVSLVERMLDATGTKPLFLYGLFLFFAIVYLLGPLITPSGSSDKYRSDKTDD